MLKNGGGSIVNLASIAGLNGIPWAGPYAATKHAIVGLTESGALDYATQRIRVNAVAPVKFRARWNMLVLHAADRDRPFLNYNAELLEMLDPQLVTPLESAVRSGSAVVASSSLCGSAYIDAGAARMPSVPLSVKMLLKQ